MHREEIIFSSFHSGANQIFLMATQHCDTRRVAAWVAGGSVQCLANESIIMASTTTSKGQTFKDDYSNKWPFIIKSPLGSEFARCSTCQQNFSIKHGGAHVIQKHINGKTYSQCVVFTRSVKN